MKDDYGNKEIFSSNLRMYVEISGKLRKDIADEMGINKSAFNSWCRGEYYPRIDHIEMLADYFGCTKSDLIESVPNSSTRINETKKNISETFHSKRKQKIIDFVAECDEKQTELLLLFINTLKGESDEPKQKQSGYNIFKKK